jgi:hypothetical protein
MLLLRRWPSVQAVAQKVFTWRLRALPYHYSAFYDAHTFGCPVMRPMFLSFPGDANALPLDQQWMLGDALLVLLAATTLPLWGHVSKHAWAYSKELAPSPAWHARAGASASQQIWL